MKTAEDFIETNEKKRLVIETKSFESVARSDEEENYEDDEVL